MVSLLCAVAMETVCGMWFFILVLESVVPLLKNRLIDHESKRGKACI